MPRAFIVVIKIAPPECGDEDKSQDDSSERPSVKHVGSSTSSNVDDSFSKDDENDESMSLDEMRGVDRETLFTTQNRRDGKQGHGGEEEEPIPPRMHEPSRDHESGCAQIEGSDSEHRLPRAPSSLNEEGHQVKHDNKKIREPECQPIRAKASGKSERHHKKPGHGGNEHQPHRSPSPRFIGQPRVGIVHPPDEH